MYNVSQYKFKEVTADRSTQLTFPVVASEHMVRVEQVIEVVFGQIHGACSWFEDGHNVILQIHIGELH